MSAVRDYNYEVISSKLNTNNADKNYNARKLLWHSCLLVKKKQTQTRNCHPNTLIFLKTMKAIFEPVLKV